MTRRRAVWLSAAGVALAGVVVWFFVLPSERAFYAYIDERRAAGLPTTRDEVRGPEPDAAENGAEDLKAAWEALLADFGAPDSWTAKRFDDIPAAPDDGWLEGLSDEQRADLAKAAARLRPGIERLARALEKPRLVFPVKLDGDGWRDVLEDIELRSNVSRVLQIQATGDDDPARRLAACRATLLLAEHSEGGTWFDWALAQAVRSGGVTMLRRGVESGAIDGAAARAACDAPLAASPARTFRAASRAEAVELLERYRDIIEGRAMSQTAKLSPWKRIEHRFDMARRRFGGTAGPLDVDFEPGIADLIVAVCRLRDAVAAVPDLRELTTEHGIAVIDSTGLLRAAKSKDGTVHMARTAVRTEAVARLARVALAVAEFRATHADFPASLDDLKPMFPDGVPLDPFTEALFTYEKSASGVRIASAGRLAGEEAIDEATLRAQCLSWELKR
jgi:hypothetical protein